MSLNLSTCHQRLGISLLPTLVCPTRAVDFVFLLPLTPFPVLAIKLSRRRNGNRMSFQSKLYRTKKVAGLVLMDLFLLFRNFQGPYSALGHPLEMGSGNSTPSMKSKLLIILQIEIKKKMLSRHSRVYSRNHDICSHVSTLWKPTVSSCAAQSPNSNHVAHQTWSDGVFLCMIFATHPGSQS